MSEQASSVENAMKVLGEFKAELSSVKKSELPGVYENFEQKFIDAIKDCVTSPAIISTAHLNSRINRQNKEHPTEVMSEGIAKPGQVKVGITMGMTQNLGDYNSAKYELYVETYTDDTQEGFDSAVERAERQATSKIKSQQNKIASYFHEKESK